MQDAACINFLQWALPQLHMRWQGFRKVRGQVCKRIQRRLNELQLADAASYRNYLEKHPQEWQVLDSLCRVTVSRFCRDRGVFALLGDQLLPELIRLLQAREETTLRCWSVGCGAGEECYSLALLWQFRLHSESPGMFLQVIGTDTDAAVLERARRACYGYSSLKRLPPEWIEQAFDHQRNEYCLQPAYQTGIEFIGQDIRREQPGGHFHVILCRNLAFTYFDAPLQAQIEQQIHAALYPGGLLVLGAHEVLLEEAGFERLHAHLPVWRKADDSAAVPG